MALYRRGGFALNAPRVITFAVSLILVAVAIASLYGHLPAGAAFVNQHRFWILALGYLVLALGCVLPGL